MTKKMTKNKMTKNKKILLAGGLALAGLLAAAAIGFRSNLLQWRRYIPTANLPANETSAPAEAEPAPEGNAVIELTDAEQKSIGVQVSDVHIQTIKKEIQTSGRVEESETGLSTISARIGGRIDKLLVNVTGDTVKAGQPVAILYSPDVLTAAEEYRLALDMRQRLNASRESQAITNADDLIRASHRRLELWGLTEEQIDTFQASPESAAEITIYSSVNGTVMKRNVTEGQYVKEGDSLYSIADLSAVWVQADIFESDVPLIRVGQIANITSPALQTGPLHGMVSFIQSTADSGTRTVAARIQIESAPPQLRPGMFVQVSFDVSLGPALLAVPRSAVLDTGKEKVVYVARGDGVFEKRPIEAETIGDDFYSVKTGLHAGERVVTQGNFLIDSQTRLTGTITGMFGGSKAFDAEGAAELNAVRSSIALRTDPSQVKSGATTTFHVTVADAAGKPVSDAQVQVMFVMPAMPSMGMGEMRSAYPLQWNGSEYTGAGTISMAGPWTVSVEARRGNQSLGAYTTSMDAK